VTSDTETVEQVKRLEHEWMDAWRRRDAPALDRYLSDDFTLTSARSTGDLVDRARWLDLAMNAYRCESFEFKRMMARLYGDVAVLNAVYHQTATADGEDWSGTFLLTDVWVHRGGEWRVVTRHSSRPVA